ncbi:hypothetical protein NQU47_04200 [Pseudoalteromonas distincta]|uniref:hypothetical protein n=1 Tax=Pseudoalteromonas distincta TaxID=77608 RepID=UPI0023401871|nr:hypothetical protein [Pseudoalteromonas distincta]MDC3211759.1 hypothetical protein [Pseudoalteromonas distincta]
MSCTREAESSVTFLKVKTRRLSILVFLIIITSWFSSYAQNKKIVELEAAVQKLNRSAKAVNSKNS